MKPLCNTSIKIFKCIFCIIHINHNFLCVSPLSVTPQPPNTFTAELLTSIRPILPRRSHNKVIMSKKSERATSMQNTVGSPLSGKGVVTNYGEGGLQNGRGGGT